MTLADLQEGESAIITKVSGRGAFRRRIMEMGFIKGTEVTVIKKAPLRDPVEYELKGYKISLRNHEASMIEVVSIEETSAMVRHSFPGTITFEQIHKTARIRSRTIHVALVGNPNAGKTTLFNFITGSNEHTANYSGVTVDARRAEVDFQGYHFIIADLPGTYSLTAFSPEERYVRRYILDQRPDIVINVVDASNLERNLYLTTQIIDMDVRTVIALNMYDELVRKGDRFDYEALGTMMGIPIIPTISSRGKGLHDLLQRCIKVYEDLDRTVRHIHINYGDEIETSIRTIQEKINIPENCDLTDSVSSRFLALKLLEKDDRIPRRIKNCANAADIEHTVKTEIARLELLYAEDIESIVTNAKYGFISGGLRETFEPGVKPKLSISDRIDNIFTGRFSGFPVFFVIMWSLFHLTFTLGQYPAVWLTSLTSLLHDFVWTYMPSGILRDMLANGIIEGVGGVLVFLPSIMILFLLISLLEDSGYMARAAFIMDRIMHRIGLHGKSFIPMLMGFGCNVPAILSTRILENRNDRLLTILIIPFMSCSARLPVYVLLISMVFPHNQSLVLLGLYVLGITMAISSALIFKKIFFKGEEAPFVMELPPYRKPTARATSRHMWDKARQYLRKMGGVILAASILIWGLSSFPRTNPEVQQIHAEIANTKNIMRDAAKYDISQKDELVNTIQLLKAKRDAARNRGSYLSTMGKTLSPVIAPLGFDWKMGVAILTGFAAKEIIVSTLGILYQNNELSETDTNLTTQLQNATHESGTLAGKKVFDPATSIGFMIFILLYLPCAATFAAIKREAGLKWAIFSAIYNTTLAWVVAFFSIHIARWVIFC